MLLQCCLSLQFHNPNVASEMAQFLISNHEKYVPSYGEKNEKTSIQTVPLHGDQLFEERARNTQWTFLKMKIHQVINYKELELNLLIGMQNSICICEVGTSCSSMNRNGKYNAAKGVEKHYNEYK